MSDSASTQLRALEGEIGEHWVEINAKDSSTWPPDDEVVWTKIDDEKGCRNETKLKLMHNLFFFPDESMYVYYLPTHWRHAE